MQRKTPIAQGFSNRWYSQIFAYPPTREATYKTSISYNYCLSMVYDILRLLYSNEKFLIKCFCNRKLPRQTY